MSDEELEVFKDWEKELFRATSFYDGEVDVNDGVPRRRRIFEDSFEDWEQNAIDGRGVGPHIMLSVVRRDKQSCFRLQEKYKGLFFVDKDPDGDNDY